MIEFETAVQALVDAGVDFVLIGGVCAALHGSARLTFDLDICYSRTSENLRRLAAALRPFHPRPRGFPAGLPFVWDESTLRNGNLFTLDTDIGAIDLLAEVSGVGSYEDLKFNSLEVDAFGRRMPILTLRGLIQAKRAAGRPKDLEALDELERLLGLQD